MFSEILLFMLFLAAVSLLAALLISYYFSSLLIRPKTFNYDETLKIELENRYFSLDFYSSLPGEEVYISSSFGTKLHGVFIPFQNSKKTVIFVHGHTYSLMGSYKYVDIFRKLGFNCLLVDNRFHGKSGGNYSTFGFYERYDLKTWADWTYGKCGPDSVIGFHGESLGSLICLMHSLLDNRSAFYILDGSTADLETLLKLRLKKDFHLPGFPVISLTDFFCKIRSGMSIYDISPVKSISSVKTPFLFIHGASDKYIPPENSLNLFNNTLSEKKIWFCQNADHSKSVIIDPTGYNKQIINFFNYINLTPIL